MTDKSFVRRLKFVVLATVGALALPSLAAASHMAGTFACSQPPSMLGFSLLDCGTFIDLFEGNDGGGPLTIGGTEYAQLAKFEDGSWTNDPGDPKMIIGFPGDHGTWSLPFPVQYLVIKGGGGGASNGGFAVYGQGGLATGSLESGIFAFNGASSGNWATAPTILDGSGEVGRFVSHLSFYGPGGPDINRMPAPATLFLIATGLLGFRALRRRHRA